MHIPQAAITAAVTGFYDDASNGLHERMRAALEAAAPHLSGTCALHGDLDQAVILAAVSNPASIVEREHRSYEPVAHWQMRAVVASLTRPRG